MALIEKLRAIGDAIREKTGESELIPLAEMPAKIRSISGGGGAESDTVALKTASYNTSFSMCCVVYVAEIREGIPTQFSISPIQGEQTLNDLLVQKLISVRLSEATDQVTVTGLAYVTDYDGMKIYRLISGQDKYSIEVFGKSHYNYGKTFNSGIKYNH